MANTENARRDPGALTAWRRVEATNTPKFYTSQAGCAASLAPEMMIIQCRESFANHDGRFRGYVAECGDISVGPTFHRPLCKLARDVIAADPAAADMPWQLVRNGKPALAGKRLANLAALEVSEEDKARFRKHRPPPAKMGHQNRRNPDSSGHVADSGGQVPETQDGAVRAIRRCGRRRKPRHNQIPGLAPEMPAGGLPGTMTQT